MEFIFLQGKILIPHYQESQLLKFSYAVTQTLPLILLVSWCRYSC